MIELTEVRFGKNLESKGIRHCILDKKGYYWFATEEGVYRWDGMNTIQFTIEDGLPTNEVYRVYEDSVGRIWVSSFSNEWSYIYHLKVFNKQTDTCLNRFTCRFNSPIIQFKQHLYFLSGEKSKYFKVDVNKLAKYEEISTGLEPSLTLRDFFVLNDSLMILIPSDIIKDASHIYNVQSRKIIDDRIPAFKSYKKFHNRLFLVDEKLGKWHLLNESLGPLKEGHYENPLDLWSPIEEVSIVYFKNKLYLNKNKKVQIPLNDEIIGEFIFNDNAIFYSQRKTYMAKYNPIINTTLYKEEDKKLIGLFKWKDQVYVLNDAYEICNVNSLHQTTVKLKFQGTYYGIRQEGKIVFIITSQYVFKFNIDTKKLEQENWGLTNIKSILVKDSTTYYVSTGTGIYRVMHNKLDKCLNSDRTYLMHIDKRNRFIRTIVEGVEIADNKFDTLANFKFIKLEKDFNPTTSQISEDQFGNLIFTTNKGLYVLLDNLKVKKIDNLAYLKRTNIIKIQFDKTNHTFWVSTTNGLNQYRYHSNLHDVQFNFINKFLLDDGLSSNKVVDVHTNDSLVYVLTENGWSVINNKNYSPNKRNFMLFLDNCEVNEKGANQTDLRKLSYDQNNLKFNLSTGYTERKSRIQVRYWFIRDKMVSDTQRSETFTIKFNALQSGSYTFYFQAIDIDYNYIISNPVKINVLIKPHFFNSVTFYFLVVSTILFLGGSIMFAFYRIKRMKEIEKMKLDKQWDEVELNSLKSQMNPHFLFNCLGSISYLMYKGDTEKAIYFLELFAKLVREGLMLSRINTITLKRELDFVSKYLELEALKFNHKFKWKIDTHEVITEEIEIPSFLIQPFVENAIKHGELGEMEEGSIEILVYQESLYTIVKILDNGIGINQSRLNKSKFQLAGHQSVSIELFKQKAELYKKMMGIVMEFELNDRYLYGLTGTEVVLKIHYVK